jgi:dTMP kinase
LLGEHLAAVRRRKRGVFITAEGIEGSGKTTQLNRLAETLRTQGFEVVETREPGGTPVAEDIRRLLLQMAGEPITPQGEVLLVLAARSQHVAHVIYPALRRGAMVLCDRFFDSTVTYQGYARGVDIAQLVRLNRFATNGLVPDLTLLFDVPVSVGLARRRHQIDGQNRLDRESVAFHERVHKGFLALARQQGRRIMKVNAKQSPDVVARRVESLVKQFLIRRGCTAGTA